MKKWLSVVGLSMALGMAGAARLQAKDPKIGKAAPNFTVVDIQGKQRSLSEFKGKYVVLEWLNHGCPFVQKHYDSGNMQSLQKEAAAKGAVWLSVVSSAKGAQGDMSSEEWMKTNQEKDAMPAAVLLDAKGKIGKTYGAKTTPHMFLIDPNGVLIYKGAIDDTPSTDKADIAGSKNYVRTALDEAMTGKPVTQPVTKSYGCLVKYK